MKTIIYLSIVICFLIQLPSINSSAQAVPTKYDVLWYRGIPPREIIT